MKNNKHTEDYELIRRCGEGDTSAFRQLVYKHKDVSLSLVLSIIKDKVIAEDVLQEVFIKVYHKLHTFKFKSAFSTWLYRIVVNTSYNELKKRKDHVRIDHIEEHTFSLSIEAGDRLGMQDQKKYIDLALLKLNEDEALILRLFYLCELSIKEIEGITSFKQSKIKVGLHRGRENLSFHLRQLLGEDIDQLL